MGRGGPCPGGWLGPGVTSPFAFQVWLELAETLAEGLEEATAAAFSQVRGFEFFFPGEWGAEETALRLPGHLSGHITPSLSPHYHLQVLTVAATEPLSLLRSVPPHPAGTTASPDQGGSAPGYPVAPPALQPHNPGAFTVDFQRVYEYLARLCRGGKGPALSPGGEWGTLMPGGCQGSCGIWGPPVSKGGLWGPLAAFGVVGWSGQGDLGKNGGGRAGRAWGCCPTLGGVSPKPEGPSIAAVPTVGLGPPREGGCGLGGGS